MSASFCSVPIEGLVYAGPRSREEFDRIPLPAQVHPWRVDETETFLRNDGQQWERQCHSKALAGPDGLEVVFQWFEARPVAAPDAAGLSAIDCTGILTGNADLSEAEQRAIEAAQANLRG